MVSIRYRKGVIVMVKDKKSVWSKPGLVVYGSVESITQYDGKPILKLGGGGDVLAEVVSTVG